MARPKKEIEELRIYQFTVRLNQAEFSTAKYYSGLTNLSISHWIRKSAFSKKPIKPKITPIAKETYTQLVKLGTNINQIALKLNTGKYTKIYRDLLDVKTLLTEISKNLSK